MPGNWIYGFMLVGSLCVAKQQLVFSKPVGAGYLLYALYAQLPVGDVENQLAL